MPEVKFMDFYSDWCAPCKKQSPIVDELENEFNDVEFKKIDIEENQEMAQEYNVSAIPTLVIECGNEEKERFVGFTEKTELKKSLNKVIENC